VYKVISSFYVVLFRFMILLSLVYDNALRIVYFGGSLHSQSAKTCMEEAD
jgi:hypothetical protein